MNLINPISLIVVIFIFFIVLAFLQDFNKDRKKITTIQQLLLYSQPLTANDFTDEDKIQNTSLAYSFKGAYLIYNIDKGKHFVGISDNIYKAVCDQLTGFGDANVYYDFQDGDNFTIKSIPLEASGYSSLEQLKKDILFTYQANSIPYNINL